MPFVVTLPTATAPGRSDRSSCLAGGAVVPAAVTRWQGGQRPSSSAASVRWSRRSGQGAVVLGSENGTRETGVWSEAVCPELRRAVWNSLTIVSSGYSNSRRQAELHWTLWSTFHCTAGKHHCLASPQNQERVGDKHDMRSMGKESYRRPSVCNT